MKDGEPKKLKKPRKRAKVEEVINRRIELAKIIEQFQKEGKLITRHSLIAELKKKGFTSDRYILYNDRTELNKGNSFIRNLTESNFSQMMQDIYQNLSWVEEEAIKQYNRKWTNSKTVEKVLEIKTKTISEKHTTEEIAQPKVAFLRIIMDIQKLKYEFLTGPNIQLSAALLSQRFQQMQQELFELKKANDLTKSYSSNE